MTKILNRAFNFNILILFSSFVLAWLLVGSFFSVNNYYQLFGLSLFLLGLFRPNYLLYLMLFMLPLFGDRPCGEQVNYLVMYSSYALFGLYGSLWIGNRFKLKRFLAKIRLNSLVNLFIYLYLFVAFLSLIGLPLLGMVKKSLEEDSLYIIKNILTVGETTLFSSTQSVLYLTQAFLFGLYIYGISRAKSKFTLFRNLMLATLLGVFFSIVIGHLNFFGLYDLSWYREIDNAGRGRFHSFFVNSSWYSQYLAILLPLLPILLLLFRQKQVAISLLVFAIILGEVTLILSMQRGAWVTYPPTLLLIWVSIYYVMAKVRNRAITLNSFLRENWIKVLITIPLTVTMSVYIVYMVKDYRKINNIENARDTFADVTSRAEIVTRSNDRLRHWPPAINLWLENPIFGGGGDSFGWQYKIYYYEEGAKFKNSETDTLHLGMWGTAHNLYLQTLVGKGIFGLIFLVGAIFLLIFTLIKREFISQREESLEKSIISLATLGSLLASVIYANVQEIFYVQSVSIIFWTIFFIGVSIAFERSNRRVRVNLRRVFIYIVTFLLILLPFHLFNISYIKDFIVNFIGREYFILDGVVWFALIAVLYTIYLQRRVIEHSSSNSLFIDCDKSEKPQMFHTKPTPRAGGVGIFLGNLFLIFNPIGWKIIVASLPAFIGGLLDDFSSLSPRVRLLFQTLSAILALFILNFTIETIGFEIEIPYLFGALISLFAIVGLINAINIIDGFNGLASGVVAMILISIGSVAWAVQDMAILEAAILNVAVVVGFMFLNYPRGRIFLGDGGAFFLGFLISTLALFLIYRNEQISIYYSFALLIYPIFEVLFSIYRRYFIKRRNITLNDKLHLHQLIFQRVTKNNPKTSKFIWIRVAPFIILTTIFYDSDLILIAISLLFMVYYINLYRKLVKFKM